MKKRARKQRGSEGTEPIRCGIVGLGRIGWGSHAKNILAHQGFDLVAVCDLEPSRLAEAEQARPGCATYTRYADLLKNRDVELVVVASQTKDHVRRSRQALAAGKHVLVEKPTARTPQAIDQLAALARRKHRIFTIHHNYRLSKDGLFVKETIDSGVLGKVFRIRCHKLSFARRNDWQTLRKYHGGAIGNWGVHLVDMCLQLVNSPVKTVWGSANHIINPGDAEDDVKAIIELKDGTVIDVELTSACAYSGPSWIVCGRHGTLWVDDEGGHLKTFDPKRLKPLQATDLHMMPTRKYGLTDGSRDEIPWVVQHVPVAPRKRYASYYDRLYASVRKGAPLLVSPASARVTYDVLARIRRGTGF
ncbi:MAG: Gfo/Idh/MocA family oxidoreductase [Kiritimatiellae bacterium]|nr:Gfo/Idh/MocA family oxidoreductase [Kiritimatiellia bacterium]